jgi:hypothetical protein
MEIQSNTDNQKNTSNKMEVSERKSGTRLLKINNSEARPDKVVVIEPIDGFPGMKEEEWVTPFGCFLF